MSSVQSKSMHISIILEAHFLSVQDREKGKYIGVGVSKWVKYTGQKLLQHFNLASRISSPAQTYSWSSYMLNKIGLVQLGNNKSNTRLTKITHNIQLMNNITMWV